MWVYEENINGRNLSDIINTEHENIKYLPGYKLPENVVAVPKLRDAAEGADLLVFVVPHQFIRSLCDDMKGCVSPKARGITLIKLSIKALVESALQLHLLDSGVRVLLIRILENGLLFKELLQTPNFRIRVADDAGALKNIVAVGAGLCDGWECSDNTKAAVIRLGLMEMIAFAKLFSKNGPVSTTTFLESCGVADLIATDEWRRFSRRRGRALRN
ncbi:Glycerol-3-phosphate dehydrogenase [Dissostichus eleginoides]|nr:Glycerol-3-phosphate dehydrogenase [Dissostichus eleginoides]